MVAWTKQPPAGTKIDWNNPLTSGLIFCVPFNEPLASHSTNGTEIHAAKDLVTGVVPTALIENSSEFSIGPRYKESSVGGLCFINKPNTITTDACGLDYGTDARFEPSEVTVITASRAYNINSSGGRVVSHSTGGGDNYGIQHVQNTDPTFMRWRWNGVSQDLDLTQGTFGDTVFCAGTAQSSTKTFQAFDATVSQLLTTSTSGTSISYTTNGLYIGTNGPSFSRSMDGEIFFVYIWDRVLSVGEQRAIWANPWQIFKPKPRFALTDMPADVRLLTAPKPWTKQPPGNTGVHGPLAPDVCLIVKGSDGVIKSVLDTAYPTSGSVIHEIDGMRHAGGGDTGISFDNTNIDPPLDGSFTFYIRDETPDGTNNEWVFEMVGGTRIFGIQHLSAFYNEWRFHYGCTNSMGFNAGPSFYSTPGGHWVTVTYETSTVPMVYLDFYMDGELISDRGDFTDLAPASAMATIDICQNSGGTLACDTSVVNNIMMHSWQLSPDEIRSLHKNPWQIFQPESIYATYPYVPAELGGPDGRDRLFTFKKGWK